MIARLLISPTLDIRVEEINKILASHLTNGTKPKNHPDVLYFPISSKLGIEQARMIKQHFFLKPNFAKGKVVVLEDASVLTVEAQNALLKTLEEPPKESLLILGATSDAKLLPTILSRCQIITLQPERLPAKHADSTKDLERLLKSDIPERFEYIEKLKEREQLLLSLTGYFHQNLRSHTTFRNTQFLRELLQAEEWVAQNVNIRAILEYLMLVMPQKL